MYELTFQEDGSFDDVDYLETWRGMEEARAQGLARSIGVSNFNASQVDRIIANSRVWPAVNQVEVGTNFVSTPCLCPIVWLGVFKSLGIVQYCGEFSSTGKVRQRKHPTLHFQDVSFAALITIPKMLLR